MSAWDEPDMFDAYDQYCEQMEGSGGIREVSGRVLSKYYTKIVYHSVTGETPRAIQLKTGSFSQSEWYPKGVCKNFDAEKKVVWVTNDFLGDNS